MSRAALQDVENNYQILSDSYFTGFSQTGNLQVFRSTVFPDIGWNYAVLLEKGRMLNPDEVAAVRQHTDASPPVFVVDKEQLDDIANLSPEDAKTFEEYSVWMSCARPKGGHEADHDIRIYEPKDVSGIDQVILPH